jgi:hypothetical protein
MIATGAIVHAARICSKRIDRRRTSRLTPELNTLYYWSAAACAEEFASRIAWSRFGSHNWIPRISGNMHSTGFLYDHCLRIEGDYQSGPERPRSNG